MKVRITAILLIIFMFYLVPIVDAQENEKHFIIINKSTNQLAYFVGDELKKLFPVATGRKASYTPEGDFSIIVKFKNPYYSAGKIPGGDPSNPLGVRWLGLDVGNTGGSKYGIHGNSNPDSIGTYASAGCIRMYNDDVTWLYDQVPTGTKVHITSSKKDFLTLATNYGYSITSTAVGLNIGELPKLNVTLDNKSLLNLVGSEYYIKNDRLMLPVRKIVAKLGYSLHWNNKEKIIALQDATTTFMIEIDKNEIKNGSTYITLQSLDQIIDSSKSNWDKATSSLQLYSIDNTY